MPVACIFVRGLVKKRHVWACTYFFVIQMLLLLGFLYFWADGLLWIVITYSALLSDAGLFQQTLKKEKQFRSYEELKQDMESINAKVKTDAEVITELVELFRSTSPVEDDVIPILSQLEYYLHQVSICLKER